MLRSTGTPAEAAASYRPLSGDDAPPTEMSGSSGAAGRLSSGVARVPPWGRLVRAGVMTLFHSRLYTLGLLVGVYSQTEVFPSYLLHTVSLASLRASHVEVLRGKANYQNSLETSTD